MSNRNAAIKVFTEYLNAIDPTGFNTKFYEQRYFSLSDNLFRKWMEGIRDGKRHLIIYAPAESGVKLDFKRNLRFAKKRGLQMIERLWFSAEGDIPANLTPVKFLVLPMLVRRQAQLLTKKTSIPPNMKRLNPLTGQPTGESQAAKMSLPESQLLAGSGLEKSLIEVLGPRGGDSGAHSALMGKIITTGQATLKELSAYSSGVDATKYMKSIFTAAHIKVRGM